MMSRTRKQRHLSTCLLFLICAVLTAQLSGCTSAAKSDKPARTVWLSSLNLEKMTAGWGTPQKDKSIQSKPLKIAGRTFDKGVGTHAASLMYIDLKNSCRSFSAYVGVDDEVNGKIGSVRFRIHVDGKRKYTSEIIRGGGKPVPVRVDLADFASGSRIDLFVDYADRADQLDRADWLDARLVK